MQFSSNIGRLKPSATIAVNTLAKELAAEGRDIINLSAGEPDFDTPAFISEAGVQGIREGKTRYTPPAGMPELRQAIAAHLAARSGREVDWNRIVVTSGAKQALFNATFSLFGPGDEVLIPTPYWTSYPDVVALARAEPVPVPGAVERDFKVTAEELEGYRTERTRGLILNTPCNPTGAVYHGHELEAIARWARGHGIWLLSDEIYHNIYHADDAPVAPGLLDLPEDALGDFVLLDGASKSYAMTGWRIGFSLSPLDLAAKMTALQSQITSNAAAPSQAAALAAFSREEEARASIAAMEQAFRRRRDLVVERMRERLPGVGFIVPTGAFYLYFRVDTLFTGEIRDATAWCSHLLREEGVALVPGAAFGDDRWVRMSYAASDETLEEAFARMGRLVSNAAGHA